MAKLLVVIDYQNDFVKGTLGFEKAKVLEAGIYNRVNKYLKNEDKVIFTYDTHYDNYLNTREGRNLPVKHCIIETEGHELYGMLKDFRGVENTLHYNKESFALSPKQMISISEEIGKEITEIELIGVATNICVISNAVVFQAQYPNAEIKVDASLTASFDEEMHQKALEVMESFHINIINK